MGSDSTNLVASAAVEMDRTLKGVMPDKWKGHGRLRIRESDLSPEQQERAVEALENLATKKPEHFDNFGAEKVANKVIEKFA